MLSIERLQVVQIQDLKPGDIARLPDHDNALLCVTEGDGNPFVFLKGAAENFRIIGRYDFFGPALIYKGVVFEVDPHTAVRNTDEAGCLSPYRGNLQLTVKFRDHVANVTIRSGLSGEGSMRIFYKKWRALIYEGDREHVLFEHEITAPSVLAIEDPG